MNNADYLQEIQELEFQAWLNEGAFSACVDGYWISIKCDDVEDYRAAGYQIRKCDLY